MTLGDLVEEQLPLTHRGSVSSFPDTNVNLRALSLHVPTFAYQRLAAGAGHTGLKRQASRRSTPELQALGGWCPSERHQTPNARTAATMSASESFDVK